MVFSPLIFFVLFMFLCEARLSPCLLLNLFSPVLRFSSSRPRKNDEPTAYFRWRSLRPSDGRRRPGAVPSFRRSSQRPSERKDEPCHGWQERVRLRRHGRVRGQLRKMWVTLFSDFFLLRRETLVYRFEGIVSSIFEFCEPLDNLTPSFSFLQWNWGLMLG